MGLPQNCGGEPGARGAVGHARSLQIVASHSEHNRFKYEHLA
jgi:hypothetical protein